MGRTFQGALLLGWIAIRRSLNKMSCGYDYPREIVRSNALVPCLTEVILASGKEKATKVVSKISVGVENPLPNGEGIAPNDRFCFAETGPNVELEEVVSLSIRRGTVLGDEARSKVVALVTKERPGTSGQDC